MNRGEQANDDRRDSTSARKAESPWHCRERKAARACSGRFAASRYTFRTFSRSIMANPLANLARQPRPRICPEPIDLARRNRQGFGGFIHREPGEEAEANDSRNVGLRFL